MKIIYSIVASCNATGCISVLENHDLILGIEHRGRMGRKYHGGEGMKSAIVTKKS